MADKKEAFRTANLRLEEAKAKYRAGKIGDEEFLVARRAADKALDALYPKQAAARDHALAENARVHTRPVRHPKGKGAMRREKKSRVMKMDRPNLGRPGKAKHRSATVHESSASPFEAMAQGGSDREHAAFVLACAFAVAHEDSDVWAAMRMSRKLGIADLSGYLHGKHFEGLVRSDESFENLSELRDLAHDFIEKHPQ